jgi:hypothetical protein
MTDGVVLVMVRAGDAVFAVMTSFARVPSPGEHVFLWLTDVQSTTLDAAFGLDKARHCVPAVVRDTVLRQKDWRKHLPAVLSPIGGMEGHVADLFADAITTEAWKAKMIRWTSGSDQL